MIRVKHQNRPVVQKKIISKNKSELRSYFERRTMFLLITQVLVYQFVDKYLGNNECTIILIDHHYFLTDLESPVVLLLLRYYTT
jgi:hypothetical protein